MSVVCVWPQQTQWPSSRPTDLIDRRPTHRAGTCRLRAVLLGEDGRENEREDEREDQEIKRK